MAATISLINDCCACNYYYFLLLFNSCKLIIQNRPLKSSCCHSLIHSGDMEIAAAASKKSWKKNAFPTYQRAGTGKGINVFV